MMRRIGQQGARALDELHKAGINLIAFSGFPQGSGAQMDFIPEKPAAFRKVAKKAKWKVANEARLPHQRRVTVVGRGPSSSASWRKNGST
jgi:hypothetical protein